MWIAVVIAVASIAIPAILLALAARYLRQRQRARTLGGYNSATLGYTYGGVPQYDPPSRTDDAAWTVESSQYPPDRPAPQ